MGTVNSKISPVFKVNDKKILAVVHKLINGANSVFFFDLERAHVYYFLLFVLVNSKRFSRAHSQISVNIDGIKYTLQNSYSDRKRRFSRPEMALFVKEVPENHSSTQ